jgi:hypothetical protein
MSLTTQQFRVDFTEFSSTQQYPNSMIQFYIDLSSKMLNVERFLDSFVYAQELFIAHTCTIEARAIKEASGGGIPGTMVAGIPTSKSVDKVSVSYDTNAIMDKAAGHWNMSVYGIRLWQLMGLFGAGPVVVGQGHAPSFSGPAWSGPDCTPSFTGFGN